MAGKKTEESNQKLVPGLNLQTYLNSSDTELNQEWSNVISLYTELKKLMRTCTPNSEAFLDQNTSPNTLESGGLNNKQVVSKRKNAKSGLKLRGNIIRKNKVVCKHKVKTFQKLNSTSNFCNKNKHDIAKPNSDVPKQIEDLMITPSEKVCKNNSEEIIKQKPPDSMKEEKHILENINPNKLDQNSEIPQFRGRSEEEVKLFSKVDNNMNIEHVKQFCLASGLETEVRNKGNYNSSFGITFSKGVTQQLYNMMYYCNDVINNNDENMTSIQFNLSYECLNNTLKQKQSSIKNKNLSISCHKSKSLGDLIPLTKQKVTSNVITGSNNSFSRRNAVCPLMNKEYKANLGHLVQQINCHYNSKEEKRTEILHTLLSPCWKQNDFIVDSCGKNNEICVQTVTVGSYTNSRHNMDDQYDGPYDYYSYNYTNNNIRSKSTDSQKILTSPKSYHGDEYSQNPSVHKVPYESRNVSPSQVHKKQKVLADTDYTPQNTRNGRQKEIYDDYQGQDPYSADVNRDYADQPNYGEQMYYQEGGMSPAQGMDEQQGYPMNEGYAVPDNRNDSVTILYKPDAYQSKDPNSPIKKDQLYSYGDPDAYPNGNYMPGNAQQMPATYDVIDMPEKQPIDYNADQTCRSKAECTCCKFCECYKRQTQNDEYKSDDFTEKRKQSVKSDKPSKSTMSAKEHGGGADMDYLDAEDASHSYKPDKSNRYEDENNYDEYPDNVPKKGSTHKAKPHSKSYDAKNSTEGLLDTYTYDQGTDVDEPYDETLLKEPSTSSSHKSGHSKHSESDKSGHKSTTHHKKTQNEHDYSGADVNPEDGEVSDDEPPCEEGKADAACDIFPLKKKKDKKSAQKSISAPPTPPATSSKKNNFIYEPKPKNLGPTVGSFVVPKPYIPCIPAPCYMPPICPLPCKPFPSKCPPPICPPKCLPQCPPPCPPPPCISPNFTATRTQQCQPPYLSSNAKTSYLSKNRVNSICAYNLVGTKPKFTVDNVKVTKNVPELNSRNKRTHEKGGITCETVVTSKGRITMCKWDNEDTNYPQINKENKNRFKKYKVRSSKSDSMLVQVKNPELKCLTYEIEDPITKINKKSKICFENGKDIVNYLSKGVQTQSVMPVRLVKNSPVQNEPKPRFSCYQNYKPKVNKNNSLVEKIKQPQKKEKSWYSHHRIDSVETQTTRSYNPQKNRSFPLTAKTIRKRYIYVPKYIHTNDKLKDIKMDKKPLDLNLNSDKTKDNVDKNSDRIPRTVSTGMNTDITKITSYILTNDKHKKSSKTSIVLESRDSDSIFKLDHATSFMNAKETTLTAKKTKSSIQLERINSQMNKQKYAVKMCETDPVPKVSKATQIYFKKVDKVPSNTILQGEDKETDNTLLSTLDGINKYISEYLKPKGVNEKKIELKARNKSMHKIHFECSLNDSGKPQCFAVHRNLHPYSELTLPSVATSEHNMKKQANKNFENIICQHIIHKDSNENFIHTKSSDKTVNLIDDLNTRKDSKKSFIHDVLLQTFVTDDKLKKEHEVTSIDKPQDTVQLCCPGCSNVYLSTKETNKRNQNDQENNHIDNQKKKNVSSKSENVSVNSVSMKNESIKIKEDNLSSKINNICTNDISLKSTEIETDISKKQLSLYTACCSKNKSNETKPSVNTVLYKNGQKFKLGQERINTSSKCSIGTLKKVNRGCSAFDVAPKTNTSTSMSQNNVFVKENEKPINENKIKDKIFDSLDFTDGLAHIFLKYLNQNARRLIFERINQNDPISSIEDIMENILNSAFVVKTKVDKCKKLKKEQSAKSIKSKRKRKLLKIKAKLKQQKSKNISKDITSLNQSNKQISAELNTENVINLSNSSTLRTSNNKEVPSKEISEKTEQTNKNESDITYKPALCETEINKSLSEMTIHSSKKTIQNNVIQPNSSTNRFSNNRRSQIKLITSLQQLYGKRRPSDKKKSENLKMSISNDKVPTEQIKKDVSEHEAAKLKHTYKSETYNLNKNVTNLQNGKPYTFQKEDRFSLDQNSLSDVDKKPTETFSFNSQNTNNNEKFPGQGQSDEMSNHNFNTTKPNYFLNNILDHLLSSNKLSLNEFSRDEFSDNYQESITGGKIGDEDIQSSIRKLESNGESEDLRSKVSGVESTNKVISIENNRAQTKVNTHTIPIHNVGHKDWNTAQLPDIIKRNETLNNFSETNSCSKRYLTENYKTCLDSIGRIDVLIKKPKIEILEHRKNIHEEKFHINNFAELNDNDFCVNKSHSNSDVKIKDPVINSNVGHKTWCNNIVSKKLDTDLEQKAAELTMKNTLNGSMSQVLNQEDISSTNNSNENEAEIDGVNIYSKNVNELQASVKSQKHSPSSSFHHPKDMQENPKNCFEGNLSKNMDDFEKNILNSSFLKLGEKKCSNSQIISANNNTQANFIEQSTVSNNIFQKTGNDGKYPLSEKKQSAQPSESSFQNKVSPPVQNNYNSELYVTPWILDVPYNTVNPYENKNDKDVVTKVNEGEYSGNIQDSVSVGESGLIKLISTDINNRKQLSVVQEAKNIIEIKDNDYFQTNNSTEKNECEMSPGSEVKTTVSVSKSDMDITTEIITFKMADKQSTKGNTIENYRDECKTTRTSEIKLSAKEDFLNIVTTPTKMESKHSSYDKITQNSKYDVDEEEIKNESPQSKTNNSINVANISELKNNGAKMPEINQSYNHEIDCEICNQYKNDINFTLLKKKSQSGKDSIKTPDIEPCIPREKITKQISSVGSYERLGEKSDHFLEQITAALEAECKKQAETNSNNKYKHKFKEFNYNRKYQEKNKPAHQEKTNDTLTQLNIDVLPRQENNTIINQVIMSTNHKKTPKIFIKENKNLVASGSSSQIKEKELIDSNVSKKEHHCNHIASLVCSREETDILCFRPSTSKAPFKVQQSLIANNELYSEITQNVQEERKLKCKSTKLESEISNLAQDKLVHNQTPTRKVEIKSNTRRQFRPENDYDNYYSQPIAKWQVTPSIESILKCTQGPSQQKTKKINKVNGTEKNINIKHEQISKKKSLRKKTDQQSFDNTKLEKRKKSHKSSNDHESFFTNFESESYKNLLSSMVASGHIPKSNEFLNMPKLNPKKTKNPIYSTITKPTTPSCSYSTSSASRIQTRAEGDSFQQTSTYMTFPCFTINDMFSFSLDSTERSHLSKTAIDTYLKSLHDLSRTLDDQLKLMKFALDEENLKLISHFHANSPSGYSKERSRQLYMHLVSVDKTAKLRNQDCDDGASPKLTDFNQAHHSKYDSNSQNSNSKYKVTKSTMLYVQKELSTLKSQIDQTPYLQLREEIISNKSLTEIEHNCLIKSIDEQLEKLKCIEEDIDNLIHELKHSIEGGKDYPNNSGPVKTNNVIKLEINKTEITFQERLKHIEEILQNELIHIQTALKEKEEITEGSSKETKNYLKITSGARKRHREKALKDRSNARKESFIEKFRRRFSDKKKNSLAPRKK